MNNLPPVIFELLFIAFIVGPLVFYPLFLGVYFKFRFKISKGSPLQYGCWFVVFGFPAVFVITWMLVRGAQSQIHSSTAFLIFVGVPGWTMVGTLWLALLVWATSHLLQILFKKRPLTGVGHRLAFGVSLAALLGTLLWGVLVLCQEHLVTLARSETADSNALRDLFRNRWAGRSPFVLGTIALRSDCPPDLLVEIVHLQDPKLHEGGSSFRGLILHPELNLAVMRIVARNPNVPVEALEILSASSDDYVKTDVAENPKTPIPVLVKLATSASFTTKTALAKNPRTPPEILDTLSKDSDRLGGKYIRENVAKNESTLATTLEVLSHDQDVRVAGAAQEGLKARKSR